MRKIDARQVRHLAADIAYERPHPAHITNGEEQGYRGARSLMSFTKGLPHRASDGLVADADDPLRLRAAINAGHTLEFDLNVPISATWHFHGGTGTDRAGLDSLDADRQHRRWEAPTAGFVYALQGPDPQAVTMPPAPTLAESANHHVNANPELVAEMAEVYWLALLRDQPFRHFDDYSEPGTPAAVDEAVNHLGALPFYADAVGSHPRRRRLTGAETVCRQTVFRGHTPGDRVGPYLSQFMLMGNRHLGGVLTEEQGQLQYGSIRADMRVRVATHGKDYMTHWNEWLDVQNGANCGGVQTYVSEPAGQFRFIATPRDLATYVHFDALYEAYLNACIWLLNVGAPRDPNFSDVLGRTRHTEGFALFGGPHILSMVTEVATRGLKAVRFQKFNMHLRLRPEALAGLVAAHHAGVLTDPALSKRARERVARFHDALAAEIANIMLLDRVGQHNAAQNTPRHDAYLGAQSGIAGATDLPLLPMAFPEGSPMHPAYGAGHATVAGACVTILKAFFDEDACIARNCQTGAVEVVSAEQITAEDWQKVVFVPTADGSAIQDLAANFDTLDYLRVGDELNKLAANISIGRNMAGVHYYSDYIDSLRLGEAIALGILQEQSVLYPKDPFRVSLTTFDGQCVVIADGEVQPVNGSAGKAAA
ncbi:MAG: bromoperoxidase [Rhodospirillales bacterium]|nr:bromoperoxidase [Rhodospirillales bacterium]